MGVFNSKTLQVNNGRTVGKSVVVSIRIGEKIGRIQYPYFSTAQCHTGSNIEACYCIRCLIEFAIAIGIFEKTDFVGSFRSIGRRLWRLVIGSADVLIHTHYLESLRIRILIVLHYPETAAVIKLQEHGLGV